jgi:hypothetical protein
MFEGPIENRLGAVPDDYVTVGISGPVISPFARAEAVDTFYLPPVHRSYPGVDHQSLSCAPGALRIRINPDAVSDDDLDAAVVAVQRGLDEATRTGNGSAQMSSSGM